MTEFDLFKALSSNRRTDGIELLGILKNAGIKDLASRGVQYASNNKAPLLGAAVGAATATALQYLANKPGKDGVSKQRALADKSLSANENSLRDMEQKGKDPGFRDQMNHARAKSSAEISRIMEKHPARGALLAAPGGAMAGAGIGLTVRKLLGG